MITDDYWQGPRKINRDHEMAVAPVAVGTLVG
jgi:hypothetical protein